MKGFPSKRYKTILVDPPWPLAQELPYEKMPISKIAALPVKRLADKDCYLFLWTTNSMLPEAFGILEAWGFKYVQTITWCKSHGLGRPPYTATEHIIMARRGQPSRSHATKALTTLAGGHGVWIQEKRVLNWFQTFTKLRHSEKPNESYDVIESLSPGPYVELFSRKKREGWDAWGKQLATLS